MKKLLLILTLFLGVISLNEAKTSNQDVSTCELNLAKEKSKLAMGMSNAAVFIQLENPKQYKIEDIVSQIFGTIESISDKAPSEFDFRNENSVMIGYHNDGIRIINSHFVNQILVERSQIMINKLNLFFNKPKIILAYMHYDSGDSFGYTLIENGFIKRFRYSLSTDWVTHEFGNPLDVELNILNGQIYYEEDEYGDRNYLYKRIDDLENPRSLHFINSELANEIMIAKIGFGIYDDHLNIPLKYVLYKN